MIPYYYNSPSNVSKERRCTVQYIEREREEEKKEKKVRKG